MKNISLNFKLLNAKYFLKTGMTSALTSPIRGFRDCFVGSTISWACHSERRSLRFSNLRFLCTSVKNVENLTRASHENTNTNSIIYMGSLTYQVKGVKVFSCMTSIGGLIVQPMLIKNVLQEMSLPLGVTLCCCVGFFTFVTPYLIHLITRKYVTEIWYNSATETYTAVLLSFFLRKININFKAEDVHVPDVLSIFTTMYIKEKPVLIAYDSFLNKEHYIKMMQYDKPLDFGFDLGSYKSKKNENLK